MSYAQQIKERQHNAIVTNDPTLVWIGKDADRQVDSLKGLLVRAELRIRYYQHMAYCNA